MKVFKLFITFLLKCCCFVLALLPLTVISLLYAIYEEHGISLLNFMICSFLVIVPSIFLIVLKRITATIFLTIFSAILMFLMLQPSIRTNDMFAGVGVLFITVGYLYGQICFGIPFGMYFHSLSLKQEERKNNEK